MHATLPAMPTDRSVPGDGVTLHVRDWGGEASALAVVLLHGLSSNARIWDRVAPRLAAAGLRPVAFDQRGHGESEQPDSGYDFTTVTSDLGHALGALGIRRPLLAGHSWGGNVALQYAAEHPGGVAGLASRSTATGSPARASASTTTCRWWMPCTSSGRPGCCPR